MGPPYIERPIRRYFRLNLNQKWPKLYEYVSIGAHLSLVLKKKSFGDQWAVLLTSRKTESSVQRMAQKWQSHI